MGVHGPVHLVDGGFQVTPDDELSDELRRLVSHDVGAQDLGVLLVSDHLHEALGVSRGEGASIADPRELAHFDLMSRVESLLLREADRGHLRMAVGAVGDVSIIHSPVSLAGDGLDTDHSLVHGLVRQELLSGTVTQSVHTSDVGAHQLIHREEPVLVELDTRRLETEVRGVRHATHRREGVLHGQGLLGAVPVLEGQEHGLLADLGPLDHGSGEEVHATLLEAALHGGRTVLVLQRKDAIQGLDDNHLGAEGIEDVSELHAHRAGADDGQ